MAKKKTPSEGFNLPIMNYYFVFLITPFKQVTLSLPLRQKSVN
jgi:hypothetical protein